MKMAGSENIDISKAEETIIDLTIDLEDASNVLNSCIDLLENSYENLTRVTSMLRILSKALCEDVEITGDLQTTMMRISKIVNGQRK